VRGRVEIRGDLERIARMALDDDILFRWRLFIRVGRGVSVEISDGCEWWVAQTITNYL